MSSLATASSTDYVPDFNGNRIMEEIYQAKMSELKSIGAEQFKENIKTKLCAVVEQIVNSMYQTLTSEIPGIRPGAHELITQEFQLFSWFASEWERLGESTTNKPIPKQPHFFIKALIDPEIGLFKYNDKFYFYRKEGVEWRQNTFFIHNWEERDTGYSAAVAAKRQNLTSVWTNRKALCLYSRDKGFTPLPRGKALNFEWGYEADVKQGEPSYKYIDKPAKGQEQTYNDVFGYRIADFEVPFIDMLVRNTHWHNMDLVELNNILIETLILFHELIHVITNTAHQAEGQDPEIETFPALPRDYPVEEFTVEDWPGFDQAKDYMAAIDEFDREEYKRIGQTIWPFWSDGSGHGVEFCNMYSLFAGMRGQTTLCSVAYEKRKKRIALQKKNPGGIARPKESDGSQKKPRAVAGQAKKKRANPKTGDDGTTTWTVPKTGSIPSFGGSQFKLKF